MTKSVNTVKVTTALFFIVAGIILLKATFVERGVLFAVDEGLDPMLYPRCLLAGWLASAVLYLVMPQARFDSDALKKSLRGLISVITVVAVYIFLFSWFGVVLSTFVFMLLFALVMGRRKPLPNIIQACLFTFITWLVFEVLLNVTMPDNIIMETFF